MVDESDFQDNDGRSIDEIEADLHAAVDKELADKEITEDAAQEEHREIEDVAANVRDRISAPDSEDPPPDE